jgi:ABC-type multidrug transport system permease subunit
MAALAKSEDSPAVEKSFGYHLITAVWIATFYVCGVGTVTTTKIVMSVLPFSLTLVAMQFGMASILTVAILIASGQRRSGYPAVTVTRLVMITGGTYALGFVLVTASMRWGKAATGEMFKDCSYCTHYL